MDELAETLMEQRFDKLYLDLDECCNKIQCAISHIDHFFQDMIDYNMLTQDQQNFQKYEKYFDVRCELASILRIHQDQALLKNIRIETKYKNFKRETLVKTDAKRLSQIMLNLLGNSIKFTDRGGEIYILVKYVQRADS